MKAFSSAMLGWALFCVTTAHAQVDYETQKWTASDASVDDSFGFAVAVSGELAIVGAYKDGDLAGEGGAAYIYNARTGQELMQLHPSDHAPWDWFGSAVAINESYAIVGSMRDDDIATQAGSAYIFDTATGVELGKFSPIDGSVDDYFGRCLAISGYTVVGGLSKDDDNGSSSGSAYLFDARTGAIIDKLLPSDGAPLDYFGISVAIEGDLVVVGAFGDDDNGPSSGSVYFFDATTGAELTKLLPDDGDSYDEFGSSVGISGDTVIVGALTNGNSGSAYIFDVSDPLSPVQTHKLIPDDGSPATLFGNTVSISNEFAVISRPYDDAAATSAGSAYLYNVENGVLITKLLASDAADGDNLGLAAAISDNTVLLGAYEDDDHGEDSGSVYTFDFSPGVPYCFGPAPQCPCGNPGNSESGCANSSGVGAQLSAYGSRSLSADVFNLNAKHLPQGPGLYFQGENTVNGGQGAFFGDGLRCAGGGVVRLEVQFSSGGTSSTTVSIATEGGVAAGQTKRYQLWYRDPVNSPCGSSFNLSNGYEVTWIP